MSLQCVYHFLTLSKGKQILNVCNMSRQQTLSSMVCRQYPPRRDMLQNPGLYRTPSYRKVGGTLVRSAPPPPTPRPSLWQRFWKSEDVRHFSTTFSLGFVGMMIFFG